MGLSSDMRLPDHRWEPRVWVVAWLLARQRSRAGDMAGLVVESR